MERGNVANAPQTPQPAAGGGAPGGAGSGATLDPGPAAASGGGPSRIANQRGPSRATATNADGSTVESVLDEDGLRTVTVRDANGEVTDEWMQAPLERSGASASTTDTHEDGSRTTTDVFQGSRMTSDYDASGELTSMRVDFDDGSSVEELRLGGGDSRVTTTNPDGSVVTEHWTDGLPTRIESPNPEGGTSVWVDVVIEEMPTP